MKRPAEQRFNPCVEAYRCAPFLMAARTSWLAQPAILLMESGKVFLPRDSSWRAAAEAELLSWTGHPKEPADFIDTLSYAARHTTQDSEPIVFEHWNPSSLPRLSHKQPLW